MFKFYQKIVLQQFKSLNRVTSLNWPNGFASATPSELKTATTQNIPSHEKPTKSPQNLGKEHPIIKDVFASIRMDDLNSDIETPSTNSKLFDAKTVNELLSISKGNGISRNHALKVVSILSNWSSSGKAQLKDFENDPRFIRLCKILIKKTPWDKHRPAPIISKSEDFSTMLSVTTDEKLVRNITIPEMIKVLTLLSVKRRRSTLLLRSLAYNIAGRPEKMNIKQCADLLYSVASLNFYDDSLFDKAANNAIEFLQKDNIKRSSVVGSILTSVGLLKYRNPALLDALSEWMVKNQSVCRPQDIFSLFMTLGVLNYIPSNSDEIFKVSVPQLTQQEAGRASAWLEIVWSLILLNQGNVDHVKSVLNEPFLQLLEEKQSLNPSAILKLLNIDGTAQYLIKNYNGPKIAKDHHIRQTEFVPTKEKSQIVDSVIDALKNLIPENYFRTRINTGLGFYIDAECALDKTCNPLPVSNPEGGERIKVAIIAYDYHDFCKGKTALTGVNALSQKLLSVMGYRILSVPYTEFQINDKIVNRVQYLENQLKALVKQ